MDWQAASLAKGESRATRGLTRVFSSDGGSTAVEVALKMPFQGGLGSDERPIVWWQVRADNAFVAEKVGAEIEMGEVAAELARFYGVPLVRALVDGRDVRIEPADLDLPFVDRVRKYPRTLGGIPSPTDTVEMREEDGGVTWSWGAMTPTTAGFLLGLWVLSWLYLAWPVVPADASYREARWELALRTGDWAHFAVTVVPSFVLTLLAVWWNVRLTLQGDRLIVEARALVRIRRREIPLSDLREVWASDLTLLLLSRTRQVWVLFFDWGASRAARFVAADLRYRLARSRSIDERTRIDAPRVDSWVGASGVRPPTSARAARQAFSADPGFRSRTSRCGA